MEGEFNKLEFNNANITFSTATSNIATSDELSASPLYQEKTGTDYSHGKKVGKRLSIIGISLVFTATAVASGSILTNIFIVNPPTIDMKRIEIVENALIYDFTVTNKMNYKTTYFIELGNKVVFKEECSEQRQYSNSYVFDAKSQQNMKFYVSFTNSFDYRKVIYSKSFIVGGN